MRIRHMPAVLRTATATPLGVFLALTLVSLVACDAVSDRRDAKRDATAPSAEQRDTAEPPDPQNGSGAAALPTAADQIGALTGRLVDAVTGLPIADAGVSLLGRDRRAISAPDGRFRFDGLKPGATTVVIGPVPDYVARSIDVRLGESGLDLGVTPMLPSNPPTLILPEYGGVVVGCDGTQMLFATRAVAGPSAVSTTCLTDAREYPAPAPAGRLPLAVVDLAPEHLAPEPNATLTVALPKQPRFGDGVPLDLLRLDLDRLIWVTTGTVVVEPGGALASGQLDQLGTYMVAAPPLGADLTVGAAGPRVQQFRLSAEAGGQPADVFPTGTEVVYASYDYASMADTPITTRAFGQGGEILFEETRRYSGRGDDSVPVVAGSSAWAPGTYNTTIYIGEPATHAYSVAWRVASAPTEIPPTPTLPSVPGAGASGSAATPVRVPPSSSSCRTPEGWYAYIVQPGDTLLSLAQRTGTTVAALQQGNCLEDTVIYSGTVIYLPRPPSRPATPLVASPPAATIYATRPPLPTAFATAAPSRPSPVITSPAPGPGMPTTWYTPPPATQPAPAPTTRPPSAVPPTTEPGPTVPPPTEAPAPPIEPTVAAPTAALPTDQVPTSQPPQPTNAPPEPTNPPPEPTTLAMQ